MLDQTILAPLRCPAQGLCTLVLPRAPFLIHSQAFLFLTQMAHLHGTECAPSAQHGHA